MLNYFVILSVIVLQSFAIKNLPKQIQLCKRSDPNVNQCVQDSIEALRSQLKVGVSELGVPGIDPFKIKELVLFRGEDGNRRDVSLKAALQNIQAVGGSDFKINKIKINTGENSDTYRFDVSFPKLAIRGDFLLRVGPFADTGKFFIDVANVDVQGIIKANIIQRNEHRQVNFTSIDFNIHLQDYGLKLDENLRGIEILRSLVDQIIRSNKQEFLDIALPFVERKVSEVFLPLANKVSEDIDYDQVFPL